jgi:hypothetical protein
MTQEEQKQMALDAHEAYLVRKQEKEKLDGEIAKLHRLADLKKYFNKFKNIFESLELDEENACYKLCGYEWSLYCSFWDKSDEPSWIICNNVKGSHLMASDLETLGASLKYQNMPKVVPTRTVTVDVPNGFTDVEIKNLVNLLAR